MPFRQEAHPRRALQYLTVTSSRLRNKAVMTAGYFLAKRATSNWDKEPAYNISNNNIDHENDKDEHET